MGTAKKKNISKPIPKGSVNTNLHTTKDSKVIRLTEISEKERISLRIDSYSYIL